MPETIRDFRGHSCVNLVVGSPSPCLAEYADPTEDTRSGQRPNGRFSRTIVKFRNVANDTHAK